MSYEEVDKKITIDEILEKLINKESYIVIKYETVSSKYLELPYRNALRDELKEQEVWVDLQELDYNNAYPPLRWEVDCIELIMEAFNAVDEGYYILRYTELYLFKGETWFIFGSNNDLKIKTIYKTEDVKSKELKK